MLRLAGFVGFFLILTCLFTSPQAGLAQTATPTSVPASTPAEARSPGLWNKICSLCKQAHYRSDRPGARGNDSTEISPNTLFSESTLALLLPTTRSLGIVLPYQMDGAVSGAPLPLDQSVILIWPQLTGLIAGTILLFALGYILFLRQEIRA